MKTSVITKLFSSLAFAATLAVAGLAYAEQAPPEPDLKETMPVLKGDQWQGLNPDAKIAFIWGVGHVVTIEEHVVQRHPELKREDFVAKLAQGLRGMPMNSIVQQVDSYYRSNPDNLDLPVMKVIWRQIVKPKLTTGIGNAPLNHND